jgi:hypothetical protein
VQDALGDMQVGGSSAFYSSNFKWSFYQILGKNQTLYQLIKKNNYTFEDLELIVDLANSSLNSQEDFNKRIDTTLQKGYAPGYVIPKQNDTIYGSIKMKGRFLLNDKINISADHGKVLSFNPDDLVEFKINDRVYKNDFIKNKKRPLNEIIKGEMSMYRDLKKGQSYLIKNANEYIPVDKKEKYLELFEDKPEIYKRIIENEYQYFEIKSMVRLYNKVP